MTLGKACARMGAMLPAYAVGALEHAEMQAVAEHLGQCETCRQQLREWKSIISAAHVAASGPTPSPDTLDRIRARIDASEMSRQQFGPTLSTRMTGGPHRDGPPLPPNSIEEEDHVNRPFRPSRASLAEVAVIGLLVVALGGGLLTRDWWGQIFSDDDSTTMLSQPTAQGQSTELSEPSEASEPVEQDESTQPVTAQTPAAGELVFSSVLSNVATHPGASLLLGRLTIEPGSSAGLQAEGQINLLVETGIVSGLIDGPAIVTRGPAGELAGQTEELENGALIELLANDHILLPIGTSIELTNSGQGLVRALEIRVQLPGPPLNLTNGVQYRQLAQATAQLMPSGQVEFSLIEGSLSAGVPLELEGPAIFYVESGTIEIAEASSEIEIKGNDEPELKATPDDIGADSNTQISDGGWFTLEAGEHASLTVGYDQVTFLELLFEAEDTPSSWTPDLSALSPSAVWHASMSLEFDP